MLFNKPSYNFSCQIEVTKKHIKGFILSKLNDKVADFQSLGVKTAIQIPRSSIDIDEGFYDTVTEIHKDCIMVEMGVMNDIQKIKFDELSAEALIRVLQSVEQI